MEVWNAIGSPLESKTVLIDFRYLTMTNTHVLAASNDMIYTWQFRTAGSGNASDGIHYCVHTHCRKRFGNES